jgi:hypothetical protein
MFAFLKRLFARPARRPAPVVHEPWSIDALRAAILMAGDPREAGERDGARNIPGPGESALSSFEINAKIRAQEILHQAETEAHRDLKLVHESLSPNPAPWNEKGRCRRAQAEAQRYAQDIGATLKDAQTQLEAVGRAANAATETYHRHLDGGAAARPRGGWISEKDRWNLVFVFLAVEVALAYGTLVGQLSPFEAAVGGATTAASSIVLGHATGLLTLRPFKKEHRLSPPRVGRLALALMLGLLELFVVLSTAVTRVVLIAGDDPTPSNLLATAADPMAILCQRETALLLLVGLGGYAAAAWHVHRYFHGVDGELRAAGLAAEVADEARRVAREAMVASVNSRSDEALSRLEGLKPAAERLAEDCAKGVGRASAIVTTANQRFERTAASLESVWREYRQNNLLYRQAAAPAWTEVTRPQALVVHDVFHTARDAAPGALAGALADIQAAYGDVARLRHDAISHIDVACGLTSVADVGGHIAPREN